MSYSFSVKAATKGEALDLVAKEFDKIVASQSVHETDRAKAFEVVAEFLAFLPDDEGQDVLASVHGSISTNDAGVYSASVGVSVQMAQRFETTTG